MNTAFETSVYVLSAKALDFLPYLLEFFIYWCNRPSPNSINQWAEAEEVLIIR